MDLANYFIDLEPETPSRKRKNECELFHSPRRFRSNTFTNIFLIYENNQIYEEKRDSTTGSRVLSDILSNERYEFYSFDNIENILFICDEIEVISEQFPVNGNFHEESPISSPFLLDFAFYHNLTFLQTLAELWKKHSLNDFLKKQPKQKLELNKKLMEGEDLCLTSTLLQAFRRFAKPRINENGENEEDDDVLLFVREVDSTKSIYFCVRRGEKTISMSYIFCLNAPIPIEIISLELDDELLSLRSQTLKLVTVCDKEEFEDIKEVLLPETFTLNDLIEKFRLSFPELKTLETFPQISTTQGVPVVDDKSLLDFIQHNVAFLVKYVKTVPILTVPSSVEENQVSPPIHSTQKRIAKELLTRTQKLLNYEVGQGFETFDFLLLVPKYNSLKQQAIDRLSEFHGLVSGLTEEDLAKKVLLYPLAKRNKDIAEEFKRRMLDPETRNTLFIVIVDECHFAPKRSAIPFIHDEEVINLPNVVFVLVSATPYNVLSSTSTVVKSFPHQTEVERVIDWYGIVKEDPIQDTYIGFEYYARSTVFTVDEDRNELHLSFGQTSHRKKFAFMSKEYAEYQAFCEDLNHSLQDICRPLFKWDGEKVKVASLDKVLTFHTSPLLEDLGFSGDLELTVGQPALSGTDFQIDSRYPVTLRLIRHDPAFNVIFKDLVLKFPHLKNRAKVSDGDEVEDVESPRSSRKKQKVLLNSKYKNIFNYDCEELKEYRSSFKQDYYPPAEARNGFIIVLDYILSICFHKIRSEYLLLQNDAKRKLKRFDADLTSKFMYLLERSCAYNDHEIKKFFNLTEEMDFYLRKLVSSYNEERKSEKLSEITSLSLALQYILQLKVDAERNSETTSEEETWYTETDRIVYKLLYGNAPIVLLRCYDTDENRTMQRILRHCLNDVCQLKRDNGLSPAFSIIGDIAETRLLDVLEPEFRMKEVSTKFGKCKLQDLPKLRAKALSADAANSSNNKRTRPTNTTDDLKYEDLEGFPCLLILCEKGRMGDTFPQSLAVLDLRMRTARAGSGFIQELGRMCRYPKYIEPALREEATKEHIIRDFATQALSFHFSCSNGCVILRSKDKSFMGLARSEYQLIKILEGAAENELFNIYHLKYSLPYALISSTYLNEIHKAIDAREKAIFNPQLTAEELEQLRNKNRILSFVKFQSGLDDYLSAKNKQAKEDFSYELNKTKGHYDYTKHSKDQKHPNRLVLKAECQIGKTGAFLGYLYYLNDWISRYIPPTTVRIPSNPSDAMMQGYRWYYPYWNRMTTRSQPRIQYSFPLKGKYHQKILHYRAALLNESYLQYHFDISSFVDNYLESIKTMELFQPYIYVDQVRQQLQGNEDWNNVMKTLLNWDGRMKFYQDEIDNYTNAIEYREGNIAELSTSKVNLMEFWKDSENLDEYDDEQGEHLRSYEDIPLVNLTETIEEGGSLVDYSAKSVLTNSSNANESLMSGIIRSYHFDKTFTQIQNQSSTSTIPSTEANEAFTIHIPSSAFSTDVFHISSNFDQALKELKKPQAIKNWMFTASYYGRTPITEKLLYRRDCFPGLTSWNDYFQVLIVRSEQYKHYNHYFGHEYIIIEMFDDFPVPYYYIEDYTMRLDEGGIGLVRRFIQYCSKEIFKLDMIWMLDDNIRDCYSFNVSKTDDNVFQDDEVIEVGPRDGGGNAMEVISRNELGYKKVSFLTVIEAIERIVSTEDNEIEQRIVSERKYKKAKELENEDQNTLLRKYGEESDELIECLYDFIGGRDAYGIIGTSRALTTQQMVLKEPIKVTHSIYSFFLLNISQCARYKLFYPPRPIWEDVEMIHMMEDKGLICCKLQLFVHYKPPHGLRSTKPRVVTPLPPPPPPPYEGLAEQGWFENFSIDHWDGRDQANRNEHLMSVCNAMREEYLTSYVEDPSACDNLILFVHCNPIGGDYYAIQEWLLVILQLKRMMTAHQFRRILLITLNDFPLIDEPTIGNFVLERNEELEGDLRVFHFQKLK